MPENAIVGDNFGTDLPKTEVPEITLADEKYKARFSKTKEFKRLKDEIENRVAYYETFLPSAGEALEAVTLSKEDFEKIGQRWVVANTVISELKSLLLIYEQAQEIVKNVSAGS